MLLYAPYSLGISVKSCKDRNVNTFWAYPSRKIDFLWRQVGIDVLSSTYNLEKHNSKAIHIHFVTKSALKHILWW